MKKAVLVAIAGVLGAFGTAVHAIPREDVLECALPGGARATLTSTYDWSPLAKIIPADVSERLNQEPWQIQFDVNGGRSKQRAPTSISHVHGVEACSRVGVIDGMLIVNMSYLEPSGKWFNNASLPRPLLLTPVTKSQPPVIRAQLQAMGAMPVLDYALIVPRNGRLVYEMALFDIKPGAPRNVVAVFQSTSADGGANWSEPQITRQAEIYVLDQPPFAQPFQGRAVKLNGKKVNPR
ncbi:hypothetical protein LJR289_003399 [Pseudoduganella sp. LjRoot289]|uniref:hypothetical protein n=1 Tax=Pseudoduganella sp. LjRoot289 TaxID=3342314 RepID=UPI003ECC2DDB